LAHGNETFFVDGLKILEQYLTKKYEWKKLVPVSRRKRLIFFYGKFPYLVILSVWDPIEQIYLRV
jgi:hypothetical protein